MDPFWFRTTCNKPRLRDPTKVLEIIDCYCIDQDMAVTIERAPDGFRLLNIEGDGWPGASRLTDADSLRDVDYGEDGLGDFEPMLLELAPCLAEPLIVQAVGTVKGAYPLSACQWRVEPFATSIDKVEFTSEGMIPPANSSTALVLLAA